MINIRWKEPTVSQRGWFSMVGKSFFMGNEPIQFGCDFNPKEWYAIYMYYNRNAEQWGAVQTIIIRFGDFLMISDQNEVTMRVWVHMTKAYISFYNQPINLPPGCGQSTMP